MRGMKKNDKTLEIVIGGEKISATDKPKEISENFSEYFKQVSIKLLEKMSSRTTVGESAIIEELQEGNNSQPFSSGEK